MNLSLARYLQSEPDSRSQDPEVQRRYLERVREDWMSITPGRFVMAKQRGQGPSGPSAVISYSDASECVQVFSRKLRIIDLVIHDAYK